VQEIDDVGRRIRLDSAQAPVLAAEEDQRVPALCPIFMQLDHPPDEDLVVAPS
jgi:hypothetical protein